MTTALDHPSARRAPPPIPFPALLGVLFALLLSAIAVRWPRGEHPTEGLAPLRTSGVGPSGEANRPPPRCDYDDVPTRDQKYSQWRTTLLDTTFALPRSYSPPDLASAESAGFRGPFLVRAFLIDDLAALRSAAEAAGIRLDLAAAYRSYAQQEDLFRRREASVGRTGALEATARPGHSEHQLGTALDFKTRGVADVTSAWGRSVAGRWMRSNAHRFGFVMSYPAGRFDASCYAYEPWHFRYFGRALAARIHSSGLTVREYLWGLEQRSSKN